MKNNGDKNKRLIYRELTDLGSFYPLDIFFDGEFLKSELLQLTDQWRVYNPKKVNNNRYGLSLFSLNGETDGTIDLNSLRSYNIENKMDFNEMSFRTPTNNWRLLTSISKRLNNFLPFLGRSHLLRIDEGGFFPPHRDLGDSFRLISFINCTDNYLSLIVDGELKRFNQNQIYFLNTKLVHSLFSTMPNALVLVLNIEICQEAAELVFKSLQQY